MPAHIFAAGIAAWFWVAVILPALRYGHSKARLITQARVVERALAHPRTCQDLCRLSTDELDELAEALGIDADAPARGNWRFRPLHRLFIALYCLAGDVTFRRARVTFGWAMNSVSNTPPCQFELVSVQIKLFFFIA